MFFVCTLTLAYHNHKCTASLVIHMYMHVKYCIDARYNERSSQMCLSICVCPWQSERKHIHKGSQTRLHTETNAVLQAKTKAVAWEHKTHVHYTLHQNGTVYMYCTACTCIYMYVRDQLATRTILKLSDRFKTDGFETISTASQWAQQL